MGQMKIKIFKGSGVTSLEAVVNNWLEEYHNKISIVDISTTVDAGVCYITVRYIKF